MFIESLQATEKAAYDDEFAKGSLDTLRAEVQQLQQQQQQEQPQHELAPEQEAAVAQQPQHEQQHELAPEQEAAVAQQQHEQEHELAPVPMPLPEQPQHEVPVALEQLPREHSCANQAHNFLANSSRAHPSMFGDMPMVCMQESCHCGNMSIALDDACYPCTYCWFVKCAQLREKRRKR